MLCSKCKKSEANVHFKEILNGKSTQMDLCGHCAENSGLSLSPLGMGNIFSSSFNFPATPPSLSEMLDFLSDWSPSQRKKRVSKSCPECQWTLSQLSKTGKLGCSQCYDHFRQDLAEVLKSIHGKTMHKGKTGRNSTAKKKQTKVTVLSLKKQLEEAVKRENYEEAARLRDQINALEKK